MKKWPKDLTKTVYFDDLIEPIKKVLLFILKNGGKKIADDVVIPYNGYNIGQDDLVCAFDPVSKFAPKQRIYDRDNQGRDIFDLLIGIAVQLGIEQGRRILRKQQFHSVNILKTDLSRLESGLARGDDEYVQEVLENMRREIEWLQK